MTRILWSRHFVFSRYYFNDFAELSGNCFRVCSRWSSDCGL